VTGSTISYHLAELEIARRETDPRHIMPEVPPEARTILDIGCGLGQTLIALLPTLADGALLVGTDIDIEAVKYGKRLGAPIQFSIANGERLPLRTSSVDFVIARVSIPYMQIDVALQEIRRVLRPGGTVWMVLHPARMYWRSVARAMRRPKPRTLFRLSYVLLNSCLYHLVGVQFRMPDGRMESFQTARGIRRSLVRQGLEVTQLNRVEHFIVQARASALSAPRPNLSE
jgi:SAM-dependent methyltransferase